MQDRDNLDLDLGQVLVTVYDADGFLGVGVDVPGGQQAGTGAFEAHYPFGYLARPRDPTPSPDGMRRLGCSVLYGYSGNSPHAWPLGEPRALGKLPQLTKGTAALYGDTGREDLPLLVLDGSTGSFALRVPHSTGGAASRILVDVETPGSEEIALAHGAGPGLRLNATGVEIHDGTLSVGPEVLRAVVVKGTTSFQAWVNAITAAVNSLGAIPPIVPPFDYLSGSTFVA